MLSTSLLNSLNDRQVVELALKEKLNFALFRLPCLGSATMYLSESVVTDFSNRENAFLIAPFRNDKVMAIPGDYCRELDIEASGSLKHGGASAIPEMPKTYSDCVSIIAARLSKEGGKTVLATVHDGHCSHCVYDIFMKLASSYPEAFVFCWMLGGESKVWAGASPELLVKTDGRTICTMALAGTRKATIDDTIPWDKKNIEEQQIVTAFITQIMQQHGLATEISAPYTKHAGNISHICTDITAVAPSGFDFRGLLNEMAPTPAVSGFPRNTALNEIARSENFDREYYAGYCGVKDEAEMRLYVTLRCMSLNPENGRCRLYAGGGITAMSVPDNEWREVCAKAATLSEALDIQFSHNSETIYISN